MALPTRWLVDHQQLLPRSGRAIDIACGTGRNAIWLAELGLTTYGVDRDEEAVRQANEMAVQRGLPLRAELVDLERGDPPIDAVAFDVVLVVHYLHRPLFPWLLGALRPGGMLIYETFTRAQAARGKPTNPAFLLEVGELRELVRPLEILVEREGDFEGKMLASVIARRPNAP